jgi:hypothetical protein
LMADPEILVVTSGSSTTGGGPNGPAFHASYALVERGFSGDPLKPGVPVVVTGHFHDRRAALCPPNDVEDCQKTFVVDRVNTVNGAQRPITTLRLVTGPGEPETSEGDVAALVTAAAPEARVLSLQLRTPDMLGDAEPGLRTDPAFAGARLVWIVSAFDLHDGHPRPRTFVLTDGTRAVVELTPNGRRGIDGPVAQPSPSQPTTVCGRLTPSSCAAVIQLVRSLHPSSVLMTGAIVVDDTCPPPRRSAGTMVITMCDRKYPFDSLVVLVPPPGGSVKPQAFEVVGLGEVPERVQPWPDAIPAHIEALIHTLP